MSATIEAATITKRFNNVVHFTMPPQKIGTQKGAWQVFD